MKEENIHSHTGINGLDKKKLTKNPNILIAASFWDEDRYHAAKVCYKFMRKIDDLVDDHKVKNKTFNNCEKEAFTEQINAWIECLDKKAANDAFMEEVLETTMKYNIPIYLFHNFSRAMIYDINNDGFPTFNSFLNYAEGASVAPASIFVHLACLYNDRSGYRVPFMDLLSFSRPCALFSYIVHIIRDFQKDMEENLNYFAMDILHNNNITCTELKLIAQNGHVPDRFRKVVSVYYDYAYEYKHQTTEVIKKLHNWLPDQYMLSFKIIYQLYDNIFEKIDVKNGNFSADELNPSIDEIIESVEELVQDQI